MEEGSCTGLAADVYPRELHLWRLTRDNENRFNEAWGDVYFELDGATISMIVGAMAQFELSNVPILEEPGVQKERFFHTPGLMGEADKRRRKEDSLRLKEILHRVPEVASQIVELGGDCNGVSMNSSVSIQNRYAKQFLK
jgi:hypothetical protein